MSEKRQPMSYGEAMAARYPEFVVRPGASCQCGDTPEPIIRVEFTKIEAQILWPVIQERAEQLAEELEQLAEEHRTTQELADILYRELGRIGANCGE